MRVEADAFALMQIPSPKTLLVNEDEGKVVREIFDLYLKHEGFRAVVHALNSHGFMAPASMKLAGKVTVP
jgi:hypothetical protein